MQNKRKLSIWFASLGLSSALALSSAYLIVPNEGQVVVNEKHVVYSDAVGIPTACWGLTGKDLYGKSFKVGDEYTEQECIQMFIPRIKEFERKVDDLVKVDYISDYEKASLISFAYNVGVVNLSNSTLLRKLNNKDHDGACDELSRWVYAQKKKLNGLVKRRAQEKAWCLGEVPKEVEDVYKEIIQIAVIPDKTKDEEFIKPTKDCQEKKK
jgi:lysozyme